MASLPWTAGGKTVCESAPEPPWALHLLVQQTLPCEASPVGALGAQSDWVDVHQGARG